LLLFDNDYRALEYSSFLRGYDYLIGLLQVLARVFDFVPVIFLVYEDVLSDFHLEI
jgi:hypothetical protein